jgi:hypothetical protein
MFHRLEFEDKEDLIRMKEEDAKNAVSLMSPTRLTSSGLPAAIGPPNPISTRDRSASTSSRHYSSASTMSSPISPVNTHFNSAIKRENSTAHTFSSSQQAAYLYGDTMPEGRINYQTTNSSHGHHSSGSYDSSSSDTSAAGSTDYRPRTTGPYQNHNRAVPDSLSMTTPRYGAAPPGRSGARTPWQGMTGSAGGINPGGGRSYTPRPSQGTNQGMYNMHEYQTYLGNQYTATDDTLSVASASPVPFSPMSPTSTQPNSAPPFSGKHGFDSSGRYYSSGN